MESKHKFKRQLSALERAHFRQPNANVVLACEINGRILPKNLQETVNKLSFKHPLLKVKIQLDENYDAWFSSENVTDITIDHISRQNDSHWQDIARKEVQRKFDVEQGPLIHFTLLSLEEKNNLIITCHHSICDGLALIFLIEDILTNLSKPNLKRDKPQFPPEINEENIPINIKPGLFKRFIINLLNKKWNKSGKNFTSQEYQEIHQNFWNSNTNNITQWSLTEVESQNFIQQCNLHKVTVTSAILSLILQAQQKIEKRKDFLNDFIVSVDFRQRLNTQADKTFAKYASAIRLNYTYKIDDDFWENTKIIQEKINTHLNNEEIFNSQQLKYFDPALIDSYNFVKYGDFSNELSERIIQKSKLDGIHYSFVLTNLGRLTIPSTYNGLKLESIYGPYVFSDTNEKYFGVSTLDNKIFFSISYGQQFISTAKINEIIHNIKTNITKIT